MLLRVQRWRADAGVKTKGRGDEEEERTDIAGNMRRDDGLDQAQRARART